MRGEGVRTQRKKLRKMEGEEGWIGGGRWRVAGWVKLRVRRAVGCFSRGVSRVARKTTSRTYVISCKVARAVAMATVERAEMTCGRGEGVFNMISPYPLSPAGVGLGEPPPRGSPPDTYG